MPYTVRGGKGVAAFTYRSVSVREALGYARSLIMSGSKGVRIQDHLGNSIEGEDLEACCQGRKSLTDDLKAV
jgi:hypothetical protein